MIDPFKISVIIPTYNAGDYLSDALDSIQRQAVVPLETIVIDDGSTDDTGQVVRQYPNVRYLYQSNEGPSAARNRGIAMAKGNLLAFCDADDWWVDDKLSLQVNRMKVHPTAQIVLGHLQREWPDGRRAEPELIFSFECSLIKREVFDQVGLLDETIRFHEDWDWFLRVKEAGVRVNIQPDVVAFYRQHDRNTSKQESSLNHNVARLIKRARDRR